MTRKQLEEMYMAYVEAAEERIEKVLETGPQWLIDAAETLDGERECDTFDPVDALWGKALTALDGYYPDERGDPLDTEEVYRGIVTGALVVHFDPSEAEDYPFYVTEAGSALRDGWVDATEWVRREFSYLSEGVQV